MTAAGAAVGAAVAGATAATPQTPTEFSYYMEIQRVLVRYAFALDDRNWSALTSCFSEDATGDYGPGYSTLEGRDAIVALCRRMLEPLDASQHLLGTMDIAFEGSKLRRAFSTFKQATTRCYFQAQHIRKAARGDALYIVAGTYADRFVREKGVWKIKRRELRATWLDGNPAVLPRR